MTTYEFARAESKCVIWPDQEQDKEYPKPAVIRISQEYEQRKRQRYIYYRKDHRADPLGYDLKVFTDRHGGYKKYQDATA